VEHLLIDGGGGEYLPFARAKVDGLRRLGLSYAEQRYEVDGVSISLRIVKEHEYIRITKQAGSVWLLLFLEGTNARARVNHSADVHEPSYMSDVVDYVRNSVLYKIPLKTPEKVTVVHSAAGSGTTELRLPCVANSDGMTSFYWETNAPYGFTSEAEAKAAVVAMCGPVHVEFPVVNLAGTDLLSVGYKSELLGPAPPNSGQYYYESFYVTGATAPATNPYGHPPYSYGTVYFEFIKLDFNPDGKEFFSDFGNLIDCPTYFVPNGDTAVLYSTVRKPAMLSSSYTGATETVKTAGQQTDRYITDSRVSWRENGIWEQLDYRFVREIIYQPSLPTVYTHTGNCASFPEQVGGDTVRFALRDNFYTTDPGYAIQNDPEYVFIGPSTSPRPIPDTLAWSSDAGPVVKYDELPPYAPVQRTRAEVGRNEQGHDFIQYPREYHAPVSRRDCTDVKFFSNWMATALSYQLAVFLKSMPSVSICVEKEGGVVKTTLDLSTLPGLHPAAKTMLQSLGVQQEGALYLLLPEGSLEWDRQGLYEIRDIQNWVDPGDGMTYRLHAVLMPDQKDLFAKGMKWL